MDERKLLGIVEQLTNWHVFDPKNAKTYPKVDAPLQVQLTNGSQKFKKLWTLETQP